ncbi:hypothetical protein CP960_07635 [Malaciobacter halophilus]|uniref:Flagellin n=1 Tax=Malaciobacter halophilus TaxID=197482 RepID=A0A2N1J2T2_9BACT|nr:hypothetical protein [Malaciobacter halophilus]AXH09808.1 hypothetical protein AHALO_1438 [Malaciobacter halophilus]PKI80865.1 hypothetical protein CP960_07635 [Malaciobacter halophilus]
MDVNSISNNVTNLNSLPQQQLNRTTQNSRIEPITNDALNLSISESYNLKRDELSNSLQTFNEGIAISSIAKNGIQKQQEIISDIKQNLLDKNIEDKNQLKEQFTNQLKDFTSIAIETKYKKESILATQDSNQENNSFTIDTKEAYLQINKVNTPIISNELANDIKNSDLNNSEELDTLVGKLNTSEKYLNDLSNQFEQTSQQIQENAKDVLKQQQELVKNNQTNNINFGKEANDFTKNNLFANVGYLAVSQANIVQEQSVRLLS